MDTKVLRQLQEEKLRRLKALRYKIDPLYWMEHRLGEDPASFKWSTHEGYANHVWDGDKDPLYTAWQTVANVYRDIHSGKDPECRKIGIEAGTGTSKTYWLARLCVWFLDVHENSLVVTTAPKKQQLQLGLWSEISMLYNKVKRLRPKSELYKLRLAMNNTGTKGIELDLDEAMTSDAWHAVGFVAGVGTAEQSANKARGFHRKDMLIILEECPGLRKPVITAFQNTCTGMHNTIVAVGNPDNQFDPLHELCEQESTKNIRVSALDYPNIVLDREIYAGGATRVSIKDRGKVYGVGSPLYNAMVRGICPTQSESSLIKLDWIEQCVGLEIAAEESTYSAVGVDVANSKAGDKACLCFGTGSKCVEIQEFQCPNATHLAYNLFMSDTQLLELGYNVYSTSKLDDYGIYPDCVGIDAVGVGVATVNGFIDHGMTPQALQGGQWVEVIPVEEKTNYDRGEVIKKPMYRFNSLRSQMYWEAREDLRNMQVSIHITDIEVLNNLKKELTIPKFDPKGGNIAVEPKEAIKKRLGKSPNVADAFVYWNWVRKGYRMDRFDVPAMIG